MAYAKSAVSSQQIIDAAIRVLARQGYAKTSLLEIAKVFDNYVRQVGQDVGKGRRAAGGEHIGNEQDAEGLSVYFLKFTAKIG